MVSQADRELISNFVTELRPFLDTVAAGVQEFAQPNRDGVVVGQAVQALVTIRGAGQILMVDGLVSIASWLTEAFELIQNNPELAPAEAVRRLSGLSSAMEDYLRGLDRGEDVDPIVLRARTIYEAIPAFSGPLPGTGRFRQRTDLDALFGDDERTAPTDRIGPPDAIDTERLRRQAGPYDSYDPTPDALPTMPLRHVEDTTPAALPDAMPTIPLQHSSQRQTDQPARIVPPPPQPTEKLPEVDPELREIFEDEALEIIGAFGDSIRILAGSPGDFEAIGQLNRAAHTLKGAANMTGFPIVGQIGAAIERLMDEHIERRKPISRDALELVAVSWKMLRAMMPHLSDLSGFTSPSNSVVQRANVLREHLEMEDAEAETLSIDHHHYGRPPAAEPVADELVEETVPAVPEPEVEPVVEAEDEALAVDTSASEDTAEIATVDAGQDVVLEEPAPAAEIVVEADVAEDLVAHTEAVEQIAVEEPLIEAAEVDATVEEFAAETAEPEDEPAQSQPFWETVDEPVSEEAEPPQSEPFWTPGTEELMRSAINTDQLVAELHGISDFDSELDLPEPEPFTVDAPQDEVSEEAATPDDGEWLSAEDEGLGTDLLNFDHRPQTEPFWSELTPPEDAASTFASDEPITFAPFFEPIEEQTPFAELEDDRPFEAEAEAAVEPWQPVGAYDSAPTSQLEIEAMGAEPESFPAEESADAPASPFGVPTFAVPAFEHDDWSGETTADETPEPWQPEASIHGEPQVEAVEEPWQSEPAFHAESHTDDSPTEPVAAMPSVADPAERIEPAMAGEMAEILAAAMLGTVEALAAREIERETDVEPELDEPATDAVLLEEVPATVEDTIQAENEDTAEPDEVEPFPGFADEIGLDPANDAIAFAPFIDSAGEADGADEPEPAGEAEMVEALLAGFDLQPFDASEAEDFDTADFAVEFPEVDDEELDRLVAEIEGDRLTTPDWLHQGDAPVVDEPEAPELEAEPEQDPIPQTGELPGATETGPLAPAASDAFNLGGISLDRFLSGEGTMALSSALLDMAFSSPLPEAADGDAGQESSISVFDESSERALEIEMFETFALEAADHLEMLGRAAMQLDRDPTGPEPLIDIKRALHTLKGAAAAAEFHAISDQAHELEDSLANHERLGTLGDRSFAAELFGAVEAIEARLARRKDELFGAREEEQDNPSLRVDIGRVDSLLNTVGELVVNRSGLEERLERLATTLGDLSTAAIRLQRSNVLLERESHAEDAIGRLLRGELAQGDAFTVDSQAHGEWDALEMDRYTEFDRLLRQLAEVGADVSAAVGEIAALRGDLDSIATRQRRLTTALQDELMGIRMVPISSLAPRLYRVVRGAAGRRGKDVSFVLEGGETPFDKLLLDTLGESLLHLLRNAVDHGIEDPATRRRLGKPETGTVRIRAFRDGSEAVIEIIDDGAGIDHEAVAQRAVERGLAADAAVSREAALALIFESGFSTRGEADDISGRGLGLEIVEQTVARYKGRVTVDSEPGRGTVFSLRLPVMLSVIQAFLVSAGDGHFAIPVANVDYVVDRVDQPLTQIGESIVVESGDQIIPVVDVGGRLGRASVPVMERDGGWVMVSEVAGKRWALVVDDLHGQQEIVVKPMGRYLRSMPGLMGATILGHGDVALIVDVPTMLGVDTLGARLATVADAAALPETPPVQPQTDILSSDPGRVILIVDDSLSVRRVVSRTVERHGWVAVMARDGAEALEILEQAPVDIVITDIEMPRMDGFELITAIRTRPALSDLPVVVLTSRSGEKHRERAFALGADEYLVKPFQEQELVGVVEDLAHTPAVAR